MQRNLVITAVVLAGALAAAPWTVSASPLDYQGLAFQSQGPAAGGPLAGAQITGAGSGPVLAATSASSEGPVYRRRPRRSRERYRDRYDDYNPTYFGAIGAGGFDPDDQPGNGLWVNGELGSEVGDALDLGVRVNWYHRESDESQVVSTYTDPAGNVGQRVIETSNVETNLVPLMAILRVRFPVSSEFQPYVGGGLGWEWLTVSGTDADGFSFQDDYDGFGGQVFAGLNVGVSPNLGLYGEALWNKSTVSARFFDPTLGDIKDEIDMDGLGLHGGLRFRF
jgi:opacity protein-like surface antigen